MDELPVIDSNLDLASRFTKGEKSLEAVGLRLVGEENLNLTCEFVQIQKGRENVLVENLRLDFGEFACREQLRAFIGWLAGAAYGT